MYIYILKCGPGLLFLGLSWPSVQVEFDMPALVHAEQGTFQPQFVTAERIREVLTSQHAKWTGLS
jgi:hypothetical protein